MIGTSVLGQTKNSPQIVSHENFSRSVSCNTRVDTSLNFVCEYYYNQTLGVWEGRERVGSRSSPGEFFVQQCHWINPICSLAVSSDL